MQKPLSAGSGKRNSQVLPAELSAPEAEKARVLVVDDDERNLLAISEVLDGTADVVCVQSGEEALRSLLREEFAVILLDVLMPGLDGYETARLVRLREQSKRTPIIFLTAINKEDGHMLRGYDVGAVDYVFKPFDPIMLRSKVKVFVELFEKTREIQQKAALEQSLLQQMLRANAEKLEAERALRQSEQREEAILRSLPVCFHARASTMPFGAYFVSDAVERLTGFSPHRFTSDAAFGLSRVHPDDLPAVQEALQGVGERGSYSCEFRWRCEDGTYRIFLDQGVMSETIDGRPPEILGTLLDITERRMLEDRLMQSQRLDAIGKLTGGLAHDFNNLLASILSGLGLLERRAQLDDKSRQIFDMTRHAAKHGAELVNRMLAFLAAPDAAAECREAVDAGRDHDRPGGADPERPHSFRMAGRPLRLARPCRCRPARACLDEPRLQCARCDAFRRHRRRSAATTAPCATAPRICRPATMSASP